MLPIKARGFIKRVRRNTGPGFSVKTCVFHVFLRIAAIKTIGSRMEISYVFFVIRCSKS